MRKRTDSIKFIISGSFIVLTLITFSLIGYFVFSNWRNSTKDVINQANKVTNNGIYNKIDEFMNLPLYINEVNHNFLKSKIVSLEDSRQRQVFFASVLKANEEQVYSFSYGDEKGEYYGARRTKEKEIEIVENNEKTGGKSKYYSITDKLISDKLVEETGEFDPRTRDWYISAKEKGVPVFSTIYKHFVMNDLAISAAYPIYDEDGVLQGVLGTHLMLSKVNECLKEVTESKNAKSYIIEKDTGLVVANSMEQSNFQTIESNATKRLSIEEISNEGIAKSYKDYKEGLGNQYTIEEEGDKLHITATDYEKQGLHWVIITAIPEKQFTAGITKSIQLSAILSFIAVLVSILVYIKSTRILLQPIYNLINTTERFSKGDFSQRVEIVRNDEIGKLSTEFNSMAEQLDVLINNLEDKVEERTQELVYVSYHDQLTGVFNRRYFEGSMAKLDVEENLPLTIIMADMNGLKLVNDSLGHSLGDELLRKTAEVIVKGVNSGNIVARLGGDEFVILMPRTDYHEAEEVISRIRALASSERVGTVSISISFGYGIKKDKEEKLEDALKKAEDYMYKRKLFESPSMRGKTINAIINTLYEKNKREEAHCRRVSHLCKLMGEALKLRKEEVQELTTLGLVHDIGKIAISESILNKEGKLTEEEWEELKRHPEIGYRILSTVNDMSEMAEYTLTHHERWDGKGYPKKLKEKEIPLQARIVAIADAYDAITSERSYRRALSQKYAIEELKKGAGIQFDPELVQVFVDMVINELPHIEKYHGGIA